MSPSSAFRRQAAWLRRFGRFLVVAAQLVALAAPCVESREEPGLAAHVEALGSKAHPGHHPEYCAACILLTVHGRPAERTELPSIERCARVSVPTVAQYAAQAGAAPANSCRAPPTIV